ncbi:cell division topological specificity factor MinE [Heliorestis acidaminivorans]|uniref:cell division topological specificity factor MinE n=1 Tax=Heliorestis acidaminivorans TaxID=553427 RepID=UPI001478530A|nr:cell division topological specificity factor MinE [Heliorestis acidaminivorans]
MNVVFKESDFLQDPNQLIIFIDDKDAEVTPQLIKAMTEDMIKVISKHIEIDCSKVKVNLSSEQDTKKIIIYIPDVTNIPRTATRI